MENIDTSRKLLYENRLMRTDEEADIFEASLSVLSKNHQIDDITYLCASFDDSTKLNDVMFGLVHLIESFYQLDEPKLVMKKFLKSIPLMRPHAEKWLKVLFYRILNNPEARVWLSISLSEVEDDVKSETIQLLTVIAIEDKDRFGDLIEDVLKK